jgi:uncharacterized protein
MHSRFYYNHAPAVLIGIVLTMPLLFWEGESITCNNDIEAWLPENSPIRATYEDFKHEFGGEEFVMIGLEGRSVDDPLVEAFAARLEHSPYIRQCLTPARFAALMRQQAVPEPQIGERIRGLTVSRDGGMIGVVALLSEEGLADRAATVQSVHQQLDYCQFRDDEVLLAGVPVVVTELDRLGSMRQNEKFFTITMLISLALLYWFVRDWKLTLAIIVLTVWGIQLTQAILKWTGGEMNFILSALPAMVMVFSLAVAIHVLHYYRLELGFAQRNLSGPDPLHRALHAAWRPCTLATLTTVIGLLSLTGSDIGPVADFGRAAAVGSVVALLVGLGLVPAAMIVWPPTARGPEQSRSTWPLRAACWIVNSRCSLTVACLSGVGVLAVGMASINSHIDPLDFLPTGSRVLNDTRRIDRELTNVESVEAIIDFGLDPASFIQKLDRIHEIEQRLADHPDVRHTLSLASFFPREFPNSTLETARLLSEASTQTGSAEYLSRGQRYWRITLRLRSLSEVQKSRVFDELQAQVPDVPMTLTGITPLLAHAQIDIFNGFWKSFATALLIITGVMVVALRSVPLALIAMIPNVTPVAIVFGILGWTGTPVDIGTMMTASIALGIAVDGTFHFLVHYQRRLRRNPDRHRATLWALLQTGAPIFSAAAVASISMLALMLSSFKPTANFGLFMSLLLVTAVFGDLCMLPAILSFGRRGRQQRRLRAVPFPIAVEPDGYRKTA